MKSFEYRLQNQVFDIKKLTCFEPVRMHQSLVCKLRKMLMDLVTATQSESKKLKDVAKQVAKQADETDTQITAEMISQMIQYSPGLDEDFPTRFYDVFGALIVSPNICKTDKEKGLDETIYSMFSMADVDRLLGEYIVNFLMPSIT